MNHKKIEKTYAIEEEIIDATLATLRNTPPPTGLEDRLIHTLEAVQQVPHSGFSTSLLRSVGWRVSHLKPVWTTNFVPLRLWVSTGLAAAALAIVFATHLHHATQTQTSPSTTAAVETPTTAPPRHKPVILSEAQRSRRTPKLSTDLNRPNLSTSASGVTASTTTPYEQAALADTLAPSQPAPPLPLTPQERLLLRCTRRGRPVEIADLDMTQQGPLQAATEAREKDLQRYIKGLLNTLIDFQPSDSAPSQDETQPPPDPPAPTQQPTLRN